MLDLGYDHLEASAIFGWIDPDELSSLWTGRSVVH